jgi:hypothetical protein
VRTVTGYAERPRVPLETKERCTMAPLGLEICLASLTAALVANSKIRQSITTALFPKPANWSLWLHATRQRVQRISSYREHADFPASNARSVGQGFERWFRSRYGSKNYSLGSGPALDFCTRVARLHSSFCKAQRNIVHSSENIIGAGRSSRPLMYARVIRVSVKTSH